jgi:hypothetical protein
MSLSIDKAECEVDTHLWEVLTEQHIRYTLHASYLSVLYVFLKPTHIVTPFVLIMSL